MISKDEAKKHGIRTTEGGVALQDNKAELIKKLKNLLPRAIDGDDHLNIGALQDLVDIAGSRSNNQGYELTFAGKGYARYLADLPTEYELKTELKQSKDFDKTSNVVIRGDNLDVLKILYQNYHGKVKMIYIDPPYNTKSEEFIYRDNFKVSDEKLIEDFGMDEETLNFLHNIYGTKTHSGWLAFMYPRLKLARELLTEDGVIFISIDDNEQGNLRIMADEIFGENNCISTFIWRKKYGGGKGANFVVDMHEYVFCYSKNIDNLDGFGIERTDKQKGIFKEIDKFKKDRGKYYIRPLKSGLAFRENLVYPIECPNGSLVKTQWICAKETFENLLKEERIVFKKLRNGKYNVYKKFYENDNEEGVLPNSIFYDVAYNQHGKEEIKSLFNVTEGRDVPFNNAKPVNLIKYISKFLPNKDSIILDFFAGSGTTGDAVMQLNAEDGGKRKFILVQLDEKIKDDKNGNAEAYRFCTSNKMEPVISSITIERLNRAGEKIKLDVAGQNGKKGELIKDEHKACPDIGYKVYHLEKKPEIYEKGGVFKSSKSRKTLDTLTNMLCASCQILDTPVEEIKKDAIYRSDNKLYLLAQVTIKELNKIEDINSLDIKLDGWADVSLEAMLNMNQSFKENLTIIY